MKGAREEKWVAQMVAAVLAVHHAEVPAGVVVVAEVIKQNLFAIN